MQKFIRANSALGGNMSELEGVPIAIRVLDQGAEVSVNVKIDDPNAPDKADALRVNVTSLEDGSDLGTRLVFWDGVKRTIQSALDSGFQVVVGTPTKGAHPTTDGYDLWTLEDALDVSDAQIQAALA